MEFDGTVGVGCVGLPHEFTVEESEYLLGVNLWSAIWPLRSIVPHMLERDRGSSSFREPSRRRDGSHA